MLIKWFLTSGLWKANKSTSDPLLSFSTMFFELLGKKVLMSKQLANGVLLNLTGYRKIIGSMLPSK
jgi:hypothetical protein